MELNDIISNRKSIRKFNNQPIDKKIVDEILESARLAPSAVNYQPWKFFICTSDKAKNAIRESYNREWFAAAQMYIVACGDHAQSWKRLSDGKDHCDIDIAIAVEHMVLKITDLGLGTCWVCNFDAAKVKEALHLPDSVEPLVLLPLGYPAENYEADARNKKRKALEEIAKWV